MTEATHSGHILQAFAATSRAVMITDSAGLIVAVNQAFTDLTEWSAAEAVGQTPGILSSGRQDARFYEAMWSMLRGAGHWQGELWNRRKGGEVYPEHLTIDAIPGGKGETTHYVAIFSNIEEQKRRETHLTSLAFYDTVTGLANRALCEDRLERAIALARRRSGYMSMAMIDLDGFKGINDRYGHECGDLILKAAGERLHSCLRESDTVSRWGGDEFAVILPAVDGANGVREVGLRMVAALRRPFVLAGDEIALGGSIGAALYPADGDDAEEILASADRAMYAVKNAGKNGFALHGEEESQTPIHRRAV